MTAGSDRIFAIAAPVSADALHAQVSPGDADSTVHVAHLEGGIARIDIGGLLRKEPTFDGPGTAALRDAVVETTDDPSIKALLLVVDSGGGSVRGVGDLADAVAAAARRKPVVARIEDLGASAAYWVASQASRVVANPTAFVGSLGTYAVVIDASGAAGQAGVAVHVIRAGKFKGAGTPGTAVTDEQLAEMQREVESFNELMLEAVARGRRLSVERVRDLADGRIHIARDAKRLGLIDAVETMADTLAALRGQASSGSTSPPTRTAAAPTRPTQASSARKEPEMDPIKAFEAAVAAKERSGLTKQQAGLAVVREQPRLHAHYIAKYNRDRGCVHATREWDAAAAQ